MVDGCHVENIEVIPYKNSLQVFKILRIFLVKLEWNNFLEKSNIPLFRSPDVTLRNSDLFVNDLFVSSYLKCQNHLSIIPSHYT